MHVHADLLLFNIDHSLANFRYRLPLSGCWFQPDIAVRGYTLPVLDYPNTALVALRVKYHAQALH